MIKKARTRLKLLLQVKLQKMTVWQRQEQENKKLLTCTMNNSDSLTCSGTINSNMYDVDRTKTRERKKRLAYRLKTASRALASQYNECSKIKCYCTWGGTWWPDLCDGLILGGSKIPMIIQLLLSLLLLLLLYKIIWAEISAIQYINKKILKGGLQLLFQIGTS
jgi:hypothetical protein